MNSSERLRTVAKRYWPLVVGAWALVAAIVMVNYSGHGASSLTTRRDGVLADRQWEYFRFPVKALSGDLAIDHERSFLSVVAERSSHVHGRRSAC